MTGGSTVELDFFRMEKETSASAVAAAPRVIKPNQLITKKLFQRRKSFRDIQSVLSKINPEVVKAVIGSAATAKPPMITMSSFSVPSTPREHQTFLNPPLPVYAPTYRPIGDCESGGETAPLTIFYNGTVAVFDCVPQKKAEYILKLAEEEKVGIAPNEFVGNFEGNLPLARRRSLERFLEKRKERLVMGSPYIKGEGVGRSTPECFCTI